MIEAEQIMKRCQAGTRNYEEANNLHAACYGIIGKLLAQPEPCDMGDICIGCSPRNADGSCPSSQRTWVGLTDVEIDYLLGSTAGENEETHISFARAIEAKIKELNT